jgi:hypothetical protein
VQTPRFRSFDNTTKKNKKQEQTINHDGMGGTRTNDPLVDDLIEGGSHVLGKDVVALIAAATVDEAAQQTTHEILAPLHSWGWSAGRATTYHFRPRPSREMNLGMIFSGNWCGPYTLLDRVMMMGRLKERW